MQDIKSWDIVKKEMESAQIKNLLVGNGFSVDFKADSFNQKSILCEMKSLQGKNEITDIEQCIKETQKLVSDGNCKTVSKELIDNWIKRELHSEFIEKLFEKMPLTVKAKKDYNIQQALAYKDFLASFDNYYSLNYDPLLYWLCLGFMSGDKDVQEYISKTECSNEEDKKEAMNKCIKKIKKENFSSFIDKQNYTLKVNYKGICVLEKKLTEAEKESLIGKTYYNKTHEIILQELENLSKNHDELKKELDNINQQLNISFDNMIKENIQLNTINNVTYYDGFLINKEAKSLEWKKDRRQNAFYLHGGFHILEKEGKTIKISAGETNSMMNNIKEEWENGYDSLTVLESEGKNKLEEIKKYPYLNYCYDSLSNISGILVTFGVSFANSDDHISKIIIENKSIDKIYLGVYKSIDGSYPDLENYQNKFKNIIDKVEFFETNSAIKVVDTNSSENFSIPY